MNKFLITIVLLLGIHFIIQPVLAADADLCCDPPYILSPGLNLCLQPGIDNATAVNPHKCTKPESVLGKIVPPKQLQGLTALGGAGGLSFFLSRMVELVYSVAAILFLFMIIFSALQWITSGGEKEAVGKARARLTYAIIGIVLLALAFPIMRLVGQITGFEFFAGQNNPPPAAEERRCCPQGTTYEATTQTCKGVVYEGANTSTISVPAIACPE